jgi:hypothetical protein
MENEKIEKCAGCEGDCADCGEFDNIVVFEDGEGNEKKGEASDSFKRAGFRWGICRELYTSPFIWIPSSKCEIVNGKCYDKFSVEAIAYDDNGKIRALAIRNDTQAQKLGKNVRAFVWQAQ